MPKKATSQEMVLKSLRKMLASARLKPGQQIVQDTLAAKLGVSRVPLREALKVLEAEGRVVHEPHRGYFVAQLDIADFIEIYRLREILETEALSVGIPLATKKDIALVTKLASDVQHFSDSSDIIGAARANRKFHFSILNLCAQVRLIRLIENLWDFTDNYRILYLSEKKNRDYVATEHAKILQAVKQKDVVKVIKLHDDHRNHAVVALKALLP